MLKRISGKHAQESYRAQRLRAWGRRRRTQLGGNIEHTGLLRPINQHWRDNRTTGLAAEFHFHNLGLGTPEQAAISAIFHV